MGTCFVRTNCPLNVAADDHAASDGGTRRLGNRWTEKAQDALKQKEAGETWKTISSVCRETETSITPCGRAVLVLSTMDQTPAHLRTSRDDVGTKFKGND